MVQDSERKAPPSKYQILHERGVLLSDEEIGFIVDQLSAGMQDVYEYLEVDLSDRTLGFISSDNLDRVGYVEEEKSINIPVAFFNKLARFQQPLRHAVITLEIFQHMEIPVSLDRYFRNAGREETIHCLQQRGLKKLNVHGIDGKKYMEASELERLLSDYEVEARNITDQIAIQKGEEPLWEKMDTYLKETYHEKYGKPLS